MYTHTYIIDGYVKYAYTNWYMDTYMNVHSRGDVAQHGAAF